MNTSNGYANSNNKNGGNRVRPVAPVSLPATSPEVYDIPFSTVVEAWLDCERRKLSSNSCVKFRWHAARELVDLWHQMRAGHYVPRASMVFMITHPVLREVWAAAFRDRVAHHWEHLRYTAAIERYIVFAGNRSMNCRKGYGAQYAVDFFRRAIHDFTEGYTRHDCYIVGGDFANFFMSIDKRVLWPLFEELVQKAYARPDMAELLYMTHVTLFHRCQDKFYRHSPEEMWRQLPPRKSLFHMDGLPIGNLPSQNWANFIGAVATVYAVYHLKVEGFVIFVDDWRGLVHSLDEGRRVIDAFRRFLADELHITLHPNKVYLQHYTKGTKFVGAVIKPPSRPGARCRTYISNRTRARFIDAVLRFNARAAAASAEAESRCNARVAAASREAAVVAMLPELRASVNSYLGMLAHYDTYKIRSRIARELILPVWGKYVYFTDEFKTLKLRPAYDLRRHLPRLLKSRPFASRFLRPKW